MNCVKDVIFSVRDHNILTWNRQFCFLQESVLTCRLPPSYHSLSWICFSRVVHNFAINMLSGRSDVLIISITKHKPDFISYSWPLPSVSWYIQQAESDIFVFQIAPCRMEQGAEYCSHAAYILFSLSHSQEHVLSLRWDLEKDQTAGSGVPPSTACQPQRLLNQPKINFLIIDILICLASGFLGQLGTSDFYPALKFSVIFNVTKIRK